MLILSSIIFVPKLFEVSIGNADGRHYDWCTAFCTAANVGVEDDAD